MMGEVEGLLNTRDCLLDLQVRLDRKVILDQLVQQVPKEVRLDQLVTLVLLVKVLPIKVTITQKQHIAITM